jgi:predicted transcriptional regulator
MVTILHTSTDRDMAAAYLAAALKTHKQAEIARHLGVGERTVRRLDSRTIHARALRLWVAMSPAI